MKTKLRALLGSSAALTAFLIAGHAYAGVSNPNYYDIDITEGAFVVVSSPSDRIGDFSGTLSGDIDSAGDWFYDDDIFPTAGTSLSGIAHLFQVNPSGTSGFIDPSTGELTLTLLVRVKFQQGAGGPSVPAGCQTSYFTIEASTRKSATYASAADFETSFGSFTVVAEDFTIPAVTSGACGAGLASTLNSTFALGSGSGSHTFYMQGTIDNPAIPSP